jgi:hypothetical protein
VSSLNPAVESIPTRKVNLASKPLILLGFVSLPRLPKTAYSGYNNPYFFSIHELPVAPYLQPKFCAEESQFKNRILRTNPKDRNLVQQVSSAKFDGTAHGGRIVLERPTGWKQLLNAII